MSVATLTAAMPRWAQHDGGGSFSCRVCGHSWSEFKVTEKGWNQVGHAKACMRGTDFEVPARVCAEIFDCLTRARVELDRLADKYDYDYLGKGPDSRALALISAELERAHELADQGAK